MIQMYHVNNVCFSVNLYPSDVEHSQENSSSFNGQMNESHPLHHTKNIPRHSVSQIKSNTKPNGILQVLYVHAILIPTKPICNLSNLCSYLVDLIQFSIQMDFWGIFLSELYIPNLS